MPLHLHVGAPVSAPFDEQLAFIARAEALGLDGVGLAEDARFGDPFTTLAIAADQTSHIWLYPAVTNPITRPPLEQATLIRALAERAPGRVKLAIGTGDAALVASGRSPARLATLRKAVLDIREALSGGSIALFDRMPAGTPQSMLPPPVAMVASGPKTLEAAAEVADEVLVTSGLALEARTAVTESIAEGAMRAGRRARGVPVTYYTLVSIDPNRELAIERTRPWIHFWLQRGIFKLSLKAMGMPVPPFAEPRNIPATFLRTAANTLVLAGTPLEVAAKVARLEADGVRTLFCMLPGGPKQHAEGLDLVAAHLLPAAHG